MVAGSKPECLAHRTLSVPLFSNEGEELPHIHVTAAGKRAKFWLNPAGLAKNFGYAAHELRAIWDLVNEPRDALERAWHAYFGR
jgi:hypothetical protein